MLDVQGNFKAGKKDINCRLRCDTVEDQEHIYIVMHWRMITMRKMYAIMTFMAMI